MNRTEFINELEFLLQDIPDEEKADAIAYYRDYLEDAGDENEEQAIREFGSPERVAAIIRADLSGNLEEGGEFTEAGYQDERFKDPGYQMAPHRHLPDVCEGTENENQNAQGSKGKKSQKKSTGNDSWLKRVLTVALLLGALAILAPLILGIGSGAIGIVAGIFALIVLAVLLIGILTIVACIVAVALLVIGVGMLFTHPMAGIVMLGVGVLVLGCAFIGIALSVLVYGTFIPFCIRQIVDLLNRLIHGRRRKPV